MSDYRNSDIHNIGKDPLFPCIQCGWCCKTLQNIPDVAGLDNGNGVCRYLNGSLCGIYKTRPLVCNVEAMYTACFEKTMTWNEFISMNIRSCIKIAKLHRDHNAINKLLALKAH
jgi:Fe-S-cluster containining protein